ncbi:glycerophosphodiester phosphodiesterase [Citrobacter sp. Marseille-Q6884]|uniref:glycerophosphodiester phosphodiesterase n=1 Tax=Citrobacter sp. Marseille-Q6884 TaxID=2956786 RepID=UPI00391F11D7
MFNNIDDIDKNIDTISNDILSLNYYNLFGKHTSSLHGGGKALGAENSLITITLLSGRNAVIDVDISTTSDDIAILLHNAVVDGVTSGTGSIFSLTYTQVRAQRVLAFDNTPYAGTPLTSWEELMRACSRRGNLVTAELKNTQATIGAMQGIYNSIKNNNMLGRVNLQCLNILRLGDYRRLSGDNDTQLLLLIYDGMPNDNLEDVINQVKAMPRVGLNIDLSYSRIYDALSMAKSNGLVYTLFTAINKTAELTNRGALGAGIQMTRDFTE